MSDWKEVWNRNARKSESFSLNVLNTEECFCKLKKLMGITSLSGKEIPFRDFFNQFKRNLKEMTFSINDENYIPHSFFDVGCGTILMALLTSLSEF